MMMKSTKGNNKRERERERERGTDRQTDKLTDRDRQTETHIEIDRQTENVMRQTTACVVVNPVMMDNCCIHGCYPNYG